MKKTRLVQMLSVALSLLLLFGVQNVESAKANFFPGDMLIIYSPSSAMVYTNTSIPLHIIAKVANPTPAVVSITYSLDDNSNVTFADLNMTLRQPGHIDGSEFYAETTLENLSEGNHTLKAYSQDAAGVQMAASVEFTIDTDFKSPLTVLSPENTTYSTTEVPLTFVCSEEFTFSWQDYILDGIGLGPIYGNLTMKNLSAGPHELVVTVWTVKGVFSETVHFTISQTPEPTPSPSPTPTASSSPEPTPTPTLTPTQETSPTTLFVSSVVAVAAVVGLGLLVYLKKRRKVAVSPNS